MPADAHPSPVNQMDTRAICISSPLADQTNTVIVDTHPPPVNLTDTTPVDMHPPTVDGLSSQDKIATPEVGTMLEELTSFRGFIVPSHLLAPLESLDAIDRDFWVGTSMLGTELATTMVIMLGEAMLLMDWS